VTKAMKSRRKVLNLLALLGFTSTNVQTLTQNARLRDGQLCVCGPEEANEGDQLCGESYTDDPDVCVCSCLCLCVGLEDDYVEYYSFYLFYKALLVQKDTY
jgi:hypothetical protein